MDLSSPQSAQSRRPVAAGFSSQFESLLSLSAAENPLPGAARPTSLSESSDVQERQQETELNQREGDEEEVRKASCRVKQ